MWRKEGGNARNPNKHLSVPTHAHPLTSSPQTLTAAAPRRPPPHTPRMLPSSATRADAAQTPPALTAATPDATLTSPTGVTITVFGTDHDTADGGPGAAILALGPAAVVVETALSPWHGRETGRTLALDTPLPPCDSPDEAHVPQAAALAARLAAAEPGSAERADLWTALETHFPSEQLAYVAALASGARLVHGDRPKAATVARLVCGLSVGELDRGLAAVTAANYVSLTLPGDEILPPDLSRGGPALAALLTERDAVLCATAAAEAEAEAKAAAAEGRAPRPLVLLVGAWHVAGVADLWPRDAWRDAATAASAPTPPFSGDAAAAGAAAALGDCLVSAIGAAPSVDALLGADGPPPLPSSPAADAERALCAEFYGTCRAQLAALTQEELAAVVSGWRCDFFDVLTPVRAARPVNGGAPDGDVLASLRMLNYVL